MTAAALATGCATTPYALPTHGETDLTLQLREGEPQIERGRPNRWIDFGHYFFSLFSKLILLDWKVNNHNIPEDVEHSLEAYLHANGICNTKVRLNQYAPGAEWQRLFRNREMPAGWRYTIGLLTVSFYTIFPDRLLAGFPIIGGGDHYNPFTNTISLYSGSRPISLHEGGHAKDLMEIENRQAKGLYAGLRAIPVLGLPLAFWQEGVATSDALSFELATAGSGESKAAYRILYPAYGTYVGSTASAVGLFVATEAWILYAAQYGTVVAGHVVGQTRALFEKERVEGLEPALLAGAGDAARACPPRAVEEVEPAEPEPAPPPEQESDPFPLTPAPDPVDPSTIP
jgi:hypothetical protein